MRFKGRQAKKTVSKTLLRTLCRCVPTLDGLEQFNLFKRDRHGPRIEDLRGVEKSLLPDLSRSFFFPVELMISLT